MLLAKEIFFIKNSAINSVFQFREITDKSHQAINDMIMNGYK